MSQLFTITSGWTGQLGPFTLKVNGIPLPLTGMTVSLVLHRYDGTAVTPGGTVVPDSDQVARPGQLSYNPGTSDFLWVAGGPKIQHHYIHWKVIDGAGKQVSFPDGDADSIGVYQL